MTMKPIQEHIGERAIEAFVEFARADLDPPDVLEGRSFSHVKEPKLRATLAQIHYGARWIYKLGLVTLVRNEERAAHVRAQIVDYAAISEALLSYCINHAIDSGHAIGTVHHWANPDEPIPARRRPIRWGQTSTEMLLRKQSFWWQARVAREFRIVNVSLFRELDWLRDQRNAVHVRQRVAVGRAAYLNESKRAFAALSECIRQTKVWCASHP